MFFGLAKNKHPKSFATFSVAPLSPDPSSTIIISEETFFCLRYAISTGTLFLNISAPLKDGMITLSCKIVLPF
jgi:hypothetical protein